MSGGKKLLAVALLVLMLGAVAAGLIWHGQHYQMVDFKFYPKDVRTLDLRGEDISYKHYDKLHRQLPQVEVVWDVPFQGSTRASNVSSLTITELSDEDVEILDYFEALETINARDCQDYDQLLALLQRRPELEIDFVLPLDGRSVSPTVSRLTLSSISQEELALLPLLRRLNTVTVTGCDNTRDIASLQEYCHKNNITFQIGLGDTEIPEDAETVTAVCIRQEDLPLLQFLPKLKQLELKTPEAPAQSLLALREQYPNVEISWSQTVAGKLFYDSDTLIDISNITVGSLEQIAEEMTYFPNASQLEMNFCGVENEDMAAFREAHREDYKVVWTVYLGPKLPTRTDVTSIMPARDGTSVFHDEEAYNMRYCEDVIAVDVGHLDVRNVEWAAFMPHLKYLILAWTGVRDLTPLSNCKELVWLELDNSPGGDTTPLIGCTALEDINIGASGVDATGLTQMPWLKNVWAIFRADAGAKVAQACPDTRVVTTGDHTVSSGWRYLPNYYAMRDALNMFYMDQ